MPNNNLKATGHIPSLQLKSMKNCCFILYFLISFSRLFAQEDLTVKDLVQICKSNAKEIDKQLLKKGFDPITGCYNGDWKMFGRGILVPENLTIYLDETDIYEIWYDYAFGSTHLALISAVQNAKNATYDSRQSKEEEKDKKTTANVYSLVVDKKTYLIRFFELKQKKGFGYKPVCDNANSTPYRMIIEEQD